MDQRITELTALTTADQADVYAIVDVSVPETKKITEADLETTIANSTHFVDELVGNTYFTTTLANDTNFIDELTNNTTFQNNVNNFVTGGGGGSGIASGKPMTFAITNYTETVDPQLVNGYQDREALVYFDDLGGTPDVILQDAQGFIQSRGLIGDWNNCDSVRGFVLIGSNLYLFLVNNGGDEGRVYLYDATDLSAGGTLCTIVGATIGGAGTIMTSNGSFIYFNADMANSGDYNDIAKLSFSGTTLTYIDTVTAGSTPGMFSSAFGVDSDGDIFGTQSGTLYQFPAAGASDPIYTGGTNADLSAILNWSNTLYGGQTTFWVKLYLPDTDIEPESSESKKVGVGTITDIQWHNFQIPFVENYPDGNNIWTGTNVDVYYSSYLEFSDAGHISSDSQVRSFTTGNPLVWADDTQVILQAVVSWGTILAQRTGWGMGDSLWTAQNTNAAVAGFVSSTAGNFFTHTGTGAAFTETAIASLASGIHVLRIEADPGNAIPQVRFYVDGVLVATHTTNVAGIEISKFSAGNDTGITGGIKVLTSPSFAVEI